MKDPFFEREAEKYDFPVASRELILSYISKHEKPVSRDELFQALGATTDVQQEALRRRLRAMERDGQLVFTRRQCYALPERLDLVRGTVIGHRDGYGFLRVDGYDSDFYLSSAQMKLAIHGDVILAQPLALDRKGRQEARVVRVLEPRKGAIVGRYFTESGIGFVVPDDNRLNFDILIPATEVNGARMGFVVVVELTQRPTNRTKAVGRIVEILGENMGTGVAVDIAIRNYDIPHVWPAAVTEQIKKITEEVAEEAKVGRVDLRNLSLVTIDGEDARDFDDAVYCEKKKGGGWRLWVAIADVSYYVQPNSPLDIEACSRGNSVYFPSQVVPMLPEVLSNGLCSLNPQVDRLCMVCEMTISEQGRLSSYQFYEAVMNSLARLTYTKVAKILEGDEELRQHYQPLVKHIEELHRLYKVLDLARQNRGGISFETEEAKFIFNADRRIERIEPTVRNDAHKLIEACMIMANVSAARFVIKNHQVGIFRVHDKPKSDSLTGLRNVLAELGLSLKGGDDPTPKDYANLMDQVAERPDHEMLQTMLLRSMKQAKYDAENRGHFGLALPAYSHFTSPIRRYSDLLIHRVIKSVLVKEGRQEKNVIVGAWDYTIQEMMQLAAHVSMTERRADEATRDVIDWLKCDFMLDHVGEVFSGMVTTVTSFGFFVRLDELFIDGLVHVSTLQNDYYQFDAEGQRLVGRASSQVYRLGDRVTVRVEAVHMDERNIDFALLSSERGNKNKGKTAKKQNKNSSPSKIGHSDEKRKKKNFKKANKPQAEGVNKKRNKKAKKSENKVDGDVS